jgi:hypothetical protein
MLFRRFRFLVLSFVLCLLLDCIDVVEKESVGTEALAHAAVLDCTVT